jgi:hypothetical protein
VLRNIGDFENAVTGIRYMIKIGGAGGWNRIYY